MFLSSSRVEWYIIWPRKAKLKVLTPGQGHDLTQTYHVTCNSIRLDKINPTKLFWSLYLVLIKSYYEKLLVTYDDVTRPSMLIAEFSGAPVNLNG